MYARVSMETRRLLAQLDRQERSFLLRWGTYVRTTAKRSIKRYAPKVASDGKTVIGGASKPGQPPKSRKGLLKRGIAYSFSNGGMIAGPEKIYGLASDGAPQTLEYGGNGSFTAKRRKPYTVGNAGPIKIAGKGKTVYGKLNTPEQAARANAIADSLYGAKTGRNVRIAERPFMRPAAAKAIANVKRLYVAKNS